VWNKVETGTITFTQKTASIIREHKAQNIDKKFDLKRINRLTTALSSTYKNHD